jgi:dTDP-4-dehydrorhamnose reductase|tara:strand:+ start:7387 stop:8793 length:1407 start_codon:yes stop_codon:yes gene_type:complete
MAKLKVLILGDGLLGSEILKQTEWACISRKRHGFDITDNSTYHLMTKVEFGSIQYCPYDVILNCIANTDTYSDNKDAHWDTNYKGVSHLIDFCNNWKVKLVHISTDYVYSNSDTEATEDTVPVHCNNWYGYTKLLGDGLVQLNSKNYLLCRCTHKPKPFPYDGAWIDQVGNFDYVSNIAKLIISMIVDDLCGLYNVGTETKTIYELASETRKVKKIYSPNHVPKNLSMNLTKLDKNLNKPFFSIAIPTYGYNGRGAEFLDFSLEIISRQTFTSFEVVLSDHSDDDTIKEVYNKWSDKMNIKYFRNSNGRGVISPNINNAMKLCSGKWIKVLFQDDFLYDENSLKIQSELLSSQPNISWVMSKFYHSNDGKTFYRLYHPKWNNMIWTGNNTMGCPTGMTIKNKNLLFFDEGLNWLMDVDYYKRMFDLHGEPSILDEVTVVNRTWGNRLTDTIPQSLKDKEFEMLKLKYA